MKKKILSMTLALTLVFGSAAALPNGIFENTSGITASAYDYYEANGYRYRILADGTVEIGYFMSDATFSSVTVPATLGGRKVTRIGSDAFYEKKIGTITVPEGVTYIGDRAFYSCTAKTIYLPGTVNTISESAFLKCANLTCISVNTANKTYATVDGCLLNKAKTEFITCPAGKTSLTVPSGVKSVRKYAIWNCNKLRTVTFANSVQTVPEDTVYYCGAVETVNFGTGFNSEIRWIIDSCPKVTAVNIAGGNQTYSSVDGVVYDKKKTTLKYVPKAKSKLTIPSTVTTIGETCCHSNTALTSLYIPNNVKVIDRYAFAHCEALKNVIFTNGLTEIKASAFQECTSLTSVSIPSGVKNIYGEAFMTCRNLSSVNISGTVTNIYGLAFAYTKISDVYIPSSIKSFDTTSRVFQEDGSFTVYGQKGTAAESYAKKYNLTFREISQPVTRFAGVGRFDTAKTISAEGVKSKSKTVVLANGMSYADALAGVPLATKLNAPILLTNKDAMPDETLGEIKRLGATKVYILGGEGAIAPNVVNVLKKNNITVERIAGSSRYGTATKIAQKLNSDPTEIFFVYGLNYADALSVSTAAAVKNAPIIYLPKDGTLDAETASYLNSVKGKVKKAYVIGGEGVISNSMMKTAGSALGLKGTAIERVFGSNRYSTCLEVNKRFSGVLTGKSLCVSTGKNFPDALAGGVLAAKNKAPLFLADGALSAEQKSYLGTRKANKFFVFGGTGAVPNSLVYSIGAASK